MFLMVSKAALRIMGGLQLIIYDKVLKIPMAGENSGKIVSLMTSDTEIIGQSLPTVSFTVTSPIQLAILLYLLYRQIGFLCFVPVGLLVIVIPLSGFFGVKLYGHFEASQKARDARVKLVNELTYSIRIIKFYT